MDCEVRRDSLKLEFIFPSLSILLCIGASGVYAYQHDWRRSLYYLLAAAITATVTF